MSDTGFVVCGTGGTSGSGTAASWGNATNITADDGNEASVTATSNGTTNYLVGSNYGFSIPTGATIDGIVVQLQLKKGYGSPIVSSVNIGKTSSTLGTAKAPGTTINSSWTNHTYGSATDLWGLTWTAAEINASTLLAQFYLVTGGVTSVQCDAVWIKVYYTVTAPAVSARSFSPGIVG